MAGLAPGPPAPGGMRDGRFGTGASGTRRNEGWQVWHRGLANGEPLPGSPRERLQLVPGDGHASFGIIIPFFRRFRKKRRIFYGITGKNAAAACKDEIYPYIIPL